MSETEAAKMSRVRLMASGSATWDLSRNDVDALRFVLVSLDAAESALAAMARERDLAHSTGRAAGLASIEIVGRIEHEETGQAYFIHRAGAYVTMLPDTDKSCAPSVHRIRDLIAIGGSCWWRDAILALLGPGEVSGG